jgi:hypothetical protein
MVLCGGPPTRGPGSLPLNLVDGLDRKRLKPAEKAAEADALEAATALSVMAEKLGVKIDCTSSKLQLPVSSLQHACSGSDTLIHSLVLQVYPAGSAYPFCRP